ncbi:MAG: hypothetical protein WBM37_05930 [Nitrososphaeraceae archaeon]
MASVSCRGTSIILSTSLVKILGSGIFVWSVMKGTIVKFDVRVWTVSNLPRISAALKQSPTSSLVSLNAVSIKFNSFTLDYRPPGIEISPV